MVKFVLPFASAILRVNLISWLLSAAVNEQFSPLEPPMTTIVINSAKVNGELEEKHTAVEPRLDHEL